MSMFCYQCEQTLDGKGCTKTGVCGKDPETATLQDLLLWAIEGVSMYAHRARKHGASDIEIDRFVVEALFSTITNVNFDSENLVQWLHSAAEIRDRARALYEGATDNPETLAGPAAWVPELDASGLRRQGEAVSTTKRIEARGAALAGLEDLVMFGLKGSAAYVDHAQILGKTDDAVFAFFHEALDFLTTEPALEDLVAMSMRVGEVNLKVMEMLDGAHTSTYGHPEPTPVRIKPRKGKAILVSGHDLKDLEALLKQTEGKGINIYTHGEMLPAHGYPGLKKYSHLVGNYGSAWQNQRREFEAFPGSILMTTNCIQKPGKNYVKRIFTTGLVEWPGVPHLKRDDFGPLIEAALAEDGFTEDGPDDTILVGFGHNAVLSVADKVVEGVKSGAIKHFFLVGGCDGAKPGRSYYTELAETIPKDSVILTLACGKYRFNTLEFGDIGGIPRLLDIGQCNDAYSAIKIASALAEAFGTDVNGLPLSMVLSWYEQKAVAILLTLLHLGVQDIRLGPTLPAFIDAAVLDVLVEKFGIKPVTTPSADLAAMLA